MNVNRVFLAGRLTRDPELRTVSGDIPVCNLSLATNRVLGSGDDRKEEACFVDVTAWRKQAETISKYFRKGDQIFIEGRLVYETWEKDGEKRSKLKVTAERFEFVDKREKTEVAF